MALTLAIANKAYSSWSMRPWLVMRHFGIVFDEAVIPMGQDETKAAMLRFSPAGKCPALNHGDLQIWDSLAIIEYVAELYPGLPVWPNDPAARAVARALAAEMHSSFMDLRRHCPMNFRRRPARASFDAQTHAAVGADVARIEAAWRDTHRAFGGEGAFLFGDFCATDAMFAPVVNRFSVYELTGAGDTSAYMAAMMALPAWQDWARGAEAEPWHLDRYDVA